MSRILIVDDEQAILNSIRRLLRLVPCSCGGTTYELTVEAFTSPKAALERAAHAAFDLALVDYRMPEMDGIELLRRLREIQPDAARLILSGYADLNALVRAIFSFGASDGITITDGMPHSVAAAATPCA